MSEVVFNLAKRTSFLVKYIPGGEPFQPLLDYGTTLTENLYKWRKGDKDLTAALVDSIKDQGDKLNEIKTIISKTSMVVDKTFELTHKSLYLEGIQKVDSAYNTFFNVTSTPEAWEKNVQMFESHYTELTTNYDHFLKPKRVNEYFKLLSETEEVGVQGMVEVATFILATEVKYHQMMVTYHCFVNDFPAVERQYENFNEHLESIHSKVRELVVTQIIPLAQTKGFKLRNSTMLHRMILLGNIEELKAVQGYVTPDILNTPTPDSKLQFYTSVVRTKSLQDPLPLVVALHMTTPAAEEIVTLFLELGADLSLPYQDGDSKTIFDAIMNESIRFNETISGEKLTNGSLLDKLIMEHNLESLNSIRGKMKVYLNSGTPGCLFGFGSFKIVVDEPLPLFVAARMAWLSGNEVYIRIARLLLQSGADPNLPATIRWSTYRFCVCWGHEKLVSLLEEFGGKRDW